MFGDKVQEKATNVGTGSYSVGGASNLIPGWNTFGSKFTTVGQKVAVWAVIDDESRWEKVVCTVDSIGPPYVLERTEVLDSSDGGTLIDWGPTETVYLYSAPFSDAFEGRWDDAAEMFVSADRKPYTAVGAANKTSAATFADDIAGRFSFDNSGAARSFTLPAISSVGIGWWVEVFGLSFLNALNLVPTGSDAIDFGAGGGTLALTGRTPVKVWKDGTQWRTSLDYSAIRAIRVQAFAADDTYTPHAKMLFALGIAVGGGGGGGGTANSGASSGAGGGGGGSGGVAMGLFSAADIGASKAVDIGAGGSAGSSGNNAGGAGADTTLGTTLLVAKGGGGGGGNAGNGIAQGGAAGTAGTGNIFAGLGTPGGPGSTGTAVIPGGYGGPSWLGGSAVATLTTTAAGGVAAVANRGGGGAGGASFNAGGAASGGAGATGYLVMIEFCWG